MSSTRALFASIGVSVSLVAAAAAALFTVSVVIAFGGWSAGLGESTPAATLVFGPTAQTRTKDAAPARAGMAPVVLRAAVKPHPPHVVAAPPVHATATVAGGSQGRVVSHAVSAVPVAQDVTPQAPPAPAATGDGVRRVGDDLSSTVHSTGQALADVTAPLSPPLSAAVQKVVDLVAALLRRTTDALGGTVDAVSQK